jgi:hypothetical protein
MFLIAYKFAAAATAKFAVGTVEFVSLKFPCLAAANLLCSGCQPIRTMTLDEAKNLIKSCASQMDAHYGKTVFDEWAVVSLAENKARVLAYIGPRNDDFLRHFAHDLGALRAELHDASYGIGDFAFARHGVGTSFEAFMVLGVGIYLICNNTRETMDMIAKDPQWLSAQVSFAELSEEIRSNPLIITSDTAFFKKN